MPDDRPRAMDKDCDGPDASPLTPLGDLDARSCPGLTWLVEGTVPGAMVWDLRRGDEDCGDVDPHADVDLGGLDHDCDEEDACA